MVSWQARQTAQRVSITHSKPAYIHRRIDNGEIVITLVPKNTTWLENAPLELLEVWSGQKQLALDGATAPMTSGELPADVLDSDDVLPEPPRQ